MSNAEPISPTLMKLLKRLKLGPMAETLPERMLLARARKMPYADWLELIFADEAQRRDRLEAHNRATRGAVDTTMTLEGWDDTARVTFDRGLWAEIVTLRFTESHNNVLLLGPVGVGKTFMANALANIACRRGRSVRCVQADKLLKLLKGSRLDQSYEATMRQYIAVDLLIIDEFALDPMDVTETRDLCDLFRERHRSGSVVIASNRDPQEWMAMMAEPLRAQSAIDRLKNSSYELVIEGESYRNRQKPTWPKP